MTKNIIRFAAFDAKEPNNPDSDRKKHGNSRWSLSNIRQWLNSTKGAN
jgi:predicted DNA-binding transcriptional regulator AlpA